jgi:hypothetical protein
MNKYLYYPLSFDELQKLVPDSSIITYNELNNINDINQLFKKYNKVVILYLLESKNSGHYVCLFRDKNKTIHFFNPFGSPPDMELDELSIIRRDELNEKFNVLTKLLNKYKNYKVNKIQYQNIKYSTCGWWCSHRLMNSDLDEEEYLNLFLDNNVKNPDLFIVKYLLENF